MHSTSPGPTSILSSVHRPSQHALKTVDGLLISVMTVRDQAPSLRPGHQIRTSRRNRPIPYPRAGIVSPACPILISSRVSMVMSLALLARRPNAEIPHLPVERAFGILHQRVFAGLQRLFRPDLVGSFRDLLLERRPRASDLRSLRWSPAGC